MLIRYWKPPGSQNSSQLFHRIVKIRQMELRLNALHTLRSSGQAFHPNQYRQHLKVETSLYPSASIGGQVGRQQRPAIEDQGGELHLTSTPPCAELLLRVLYQLALCWEGSFHICLQRTWDLWRALSQRSQLLPFRGPIGCRRPPVRDKTIEIPGCVAPLWYIPPLPPGTVAPKGKRHQGW